MDIDNYTIFPLGDTALTIDFGNYIDSNLNKKVIHLCKIVKAANLPAVTDIIPAYSSLTVYYDLITLRKLHPGASAFSTIKRKLETLLLQERETTEQPPRRLTIPVCYAAKYALDSEEVTKITRLCFDEIIHIHTSQIYRVYMVGFLPGFAYMGEVDARIAVPRRQEPRIRIEAGCAGIAGKQTGIYSLTSPGGWHIIGRTPLRLFDKEKEEPTLFKAGDEVQFFSIGEDEFENY